MSSGLNLNTVPAGPLSISMQLHKNVHIGLWWTSAVQTVRVRSSTDGSPGAWIKVNYFKVAAKTIK